MTPKQRQRIREHVWGERKLPLLTTLQRQARLANYKPRGNGRRKSRRES